MVLEILKELEIVSCTSSRKNSGGLRHHYSYLIGATTTFDKEPQIMGAMKNREEK